MLIKWLTNNDGPTIDGVAVACNGHTASHTRDADTAASDRVGARWRGHYTVALSSSKYGNTAYLFINLLLLLLLLLALITVIAYHINSMRSIKIIVCAYQMTRSSSGMLITWYFYI